jgi:hypothetical protein
MTEIFVGNPSGGFCDPASSGESGPTGIIVGPASLPAKLQTGQTAFHRERLPWETSETFASAVRVFISVDLKEWRR